MLDDLLTQVPEGDLAVATLRRDIPEQVRTSHLVDATPLDLDRLAQRLQAALTGNPRLFGGYRDARTLRLGLPNDVLRFAGRAPGLCALCLGAIVTVTPAGLPRALAVGLLTAAMVASWWFARRSLRARFMGGPGGVGGPRLAVGPDDWRRFLRSGLVGGRGARRVGRQAVPARLQVAVPGQCGAVDATRVTPYRDHYLHRRRLNLEQSCCGHRRLTTEFLNRLIEVSLSLQFLGATCPPESGRGFGGGP